MISKSIHWSIICTIFQDEVVSDSAPVIKDLLTKEDVDVLTYLSWDNEVTIQSNLWKLRDLSQWFYFLAHLAELIKAPVSFPDKNMSIAFQRQRLFCLYCKLFTLSFLQNTGLISTKLCIKHFGGEGVLFCSNEGQGHL